MKRPASSLSSASAGAYRTPAEPCTAPGAPRELVYVPLGESARATLPTSFARRFAFPAGAALFGAWAWGPVGALVGGASGVLLGIWTGRADTSRAGAVLRVEAGVIHVSVGATGREERFRLDDLSDVVLDVKTIERVIEGGSAIPAVRFLESRVGPKLDTARIVLVSGSGREVRLTDEYLPNFDATEWLGKVRLFLRRHGWLPAGERRSESDDDDEV